MLPENSQLNICFAHVAYRMQDRFEARGNGHQELPGVVAR